MSSCYIVNVCRIYSVVPVLFFILRTCCHFLYFLYKDINTFVGSKKQLFLFSSQYSMKFPLKSQTCLRGVKENKKSILVLFYFSLKQYEERERTGNGKEAEGVILVRNQREKMRKGEGATFEVAYYLHCTLPYLFVNLSSSLFPSFSQI